MSRASTIRSAVSSVIHCRYAASVEVSVIERYKSWYTILDKVTINITKCFGSPSFLSFPQSWHNHAGLKERACSLRQRWVKQEIEETNVRGAHTNRGIPPDTQWAHASTLFSASRTHCAKRQMDGWWISESRGRMLRESRILTSIKTLTHSPTTSLESIKAAEWATRMVLDENHEMSVIEFTPDWPEWITLNKIRF